MFRIEDLITKEERAVMYAVAANMKLDKRSVNAQLAIARRLK